MRPLEIIIPIILAIHLSWPLAGKKRSPVITLLPVLALLITAAHANFEGMRWQMAPLYAFVLATCLLSMPALLKTQARTDSPIRPMRVIINLVMLALATAIPILLPVPSIPLPSGPYQVGTRFYELADTSRKELYSGRDEARRFQIQIWYPAEAAPSNERARWMANAEVFAPLISSYLDLPSFFLDHLALVTVPAIPDSEVVAADSGFPVIFFSHGWNGFNAQNTGQALQLASHGYVVVGVQHTYGAVVTVFKDGMTARNNPSALPAGKPDDEYETAARKLVGQWAGDIGFSLGFLETENGNPNSPFHKALDLSRVGVYGHSTGGGAAIQFCGTDARCKAVLGQDPFMRPVSPDVLESGVTQPSFFLFSQAWADEVGSRNNQLFDPFYAHSAKTYGQLYLEGTSHYDFSDLPLLSPLAHQLKLKGPIDGKRAMVIINNYLLSFFDGTLKGTSTDLFAKPSPYPEVKPKQCSCQ